MPHLTLNYTAVLDVVFPALAVVVHGRPRHHHHGGGE